MLLLDFEMKATRPELEENGTDLFLASPPHLAGSGRDRAAAIGRGAARHTRAFKIHSGDNTASQSIRCTFSMLKRP